jgi:hypothetical protein
MTTIIILITNKLLYFLPDHKANMRTSVKVQVRFEVMIVFRLFIIQSDTFTIFHTKTQ